MKSCYSLRMQARAVLSLLLALALAVAPLVSTAATSCVAAMSVSAQDNGAASADHHRMHGVQPDVVTDAPDSGCMDHGQCKVSCAAHCVSLLPPTVQAAPGGEPIQTTQVAVLGPAFTPDTPSRPPQSIL